MIVLGRRMAIFLLVRSIVTVGVADRVPSLAAAQEKEDAENDTNQNQGADGGRNSSNRSWREASGVRKVDGCFCRLRSCCVGRRQLYRPLVKCRKFSYANDLT